MTNLIFFFRLLSTQGGTSIAVELSTVLRDDDKPRKNFLVLNKQATWYDNPATHCSKWAVNSFPKVPSTNLPLIKAGLSDNSGDELVVQQVVALEHVT